MSKEYIPKEPGDNDHKVMQDDFDHLYISRTHMKLRENQARLERMKEEYSMSEICYSGDTPSNS